MTHCAISAKLKTNFFLNPCQTGNHEFLQKPKKIECDKNSEFNFLSILQSDESKNIVSNMFLSGIVSEQSCIDSATNIFANFLVNTAERAASSENKLEFSCPKKSQSRNWKFKKQKKTVKYPKWHDASCESLNKQISLSSYLLKKDPKNSFLRGRIISETKAYKKLVKSKHKEHLGQMFSQLDQMQHSDTRGYMQLIKSLGHGSFDKPVSADSDHVHPDTWYQHFQSLLGHKVPEAPEDEIMTEYIEQNACKCSTELDRTFSKLDFLEAVATLQNNKSSSFDRVTNEMLKAGRHIIAEPVLSLFNKILDSSIYPSSWKLDILTPLHKSGEKSDPNNFRGILVSSCF